MTTETGKQTEILERTNKDEYDLEQIVEKSSLEKLKMNEKRTRKLFRSSRKKTHHYREYTRHFVIMPIIKNKNSDNNYIMYTRVILPQIKSNSNEIKVISHLHQKVDGAYIEMNHVTKRINLSVNLKQFYAKEGTLYLKSLIVTMPEVIREINANYDKLFFNYITEKRKKSTINKHEPFHILSRIGTEYIDGAKKPIKVEWTMQQNSDSYNSESLDIVSKANLLNTDYIMIQRKKTLTDLDVVTRFHKLNGNNNEVDAFKLFVKDKYRNYFNMSYDQITQDVKNIKIKLN